MKNIKVKDNLGQKAINYTVKSDDKTYEFESVFLGTQKIKKRNS